MWCFRAICNLTYEFESQISSFDRKWRITTIMICVSNTFSSRFLSALHRVSKLFCKQFSNVCFIEKCLAIPPLLYKSYQLSKPQFKVGLYVFLVYFFTVYYIKNISCNGSKKVCNVFTENDGIRLGTIDPSDAISERPNTPLSTTYLWWNRSAIFSRSLSKYLVSLGS